MTNPTPSAPGEGATITYEEIQNMIEQYGWRRQIQGLWAERDHFDPRHQRAIEHAAETRKELNEKIQSLFAAAAPRPAEEADGLALPEPPVVELQHVTFEAAEDTFPKVWRGDFDDAPIETDDDEIGVLPAFRDEWIEADQSPSDSLTVRIDDAGAAHLLALDDDGCGITIPKERRREIAGKLMDVDDATIKSIESAVQCATWLRPEPGDIGRAVLAAIFGPKVILGEPA